MADIRRYGCKRDTHDYRDRTIPSRMRSQGVPAKTNNRQYCGKIKDQGAEGSCTGHAIASTAEWISRRYGKQPIDFSPQFSYMQHLLWEKTWPLDDGAMPRTICTVASLLGLCEESLFPYIPGQIIRPTEDQVLNAATHKLGGYHRLAGLQDVLGCLGDPVPWPVLVGFNVYASFDTSQVAASGNVPMPDEHDVLLGGHEVMAIDYSMDDHVVICQNSYGKQWGDGGFFTLPFEYVNRQDLCGDLWTIHPGFWGQK